MGLVKLATERRVTIVMFTVAILLFGFVSLSRLKLDLLPDLAYPTLTIRTSLVGAAPQEVESLLTKPIEEAVGIIKNVRRVRSVSRTGQSDVTLEFLWGTDMDVAGVEVREKLDVLELPLETERPLLLRFDPAAEPIMRLALLAESAQKPGDDRLRYLRRFAEDRLKNDLEAVEGTAAVKISGGREDEIEILVDQQKLAQLDLSISTIAARVRAENINLSGGRLEQGAQRFLVRTINEFRSVPAIADAIVAVRDDAPVYLRDVARVSQGYKELEAITRLDGRESVELAVYKEGDANTVRIAERIRERVESLREQIPEDSELRIVYDQSAFISAAVADVRSAAVWGGLLAVLVLYLFLRDARATAIVGIAIPISVIGTFLAMYSAGLTLNIMSLGGIALAVGMLVDNSIVVLENIVRRREQGASLLESARLGTSQVATAVTASTLTTIAVFFPMVFVSGIAGQLFRDQSLTVTFALSFSLLVALTLIPMLASLGGGPDRPVAESTVPAKFTRGSAVVVRMLVRCAALLTAPLRALLGPAAHGCRAAMRSLEMRYPAVLRWALAHRSAVVLLAAGLFAASMGLLPRLGAELIPQLSQGEFALDLTLPPGTPLAQTDTMLRTAMDHAEAMPEVALTYSVAGTGNRLDANPVDAGEHKGRLNIILAADATDAETVVKRRLRSVLERLPGLQYEFAPPSLFALAPPLEIELTGYDLDRLAAAARRVGAELAVSPRFADITNSYQAGTPEIQIVFDHERAAALGLVVRDIADQVVASVRGELATRYSWHDRKIDVLVRSVDAEQASIGALRSLIVNPESPRPITLEAVADVRVATGPAEIRRVDQARVAIITANLTRGDLGSAVEEIERLLADIELPSGVSAAVSGQNEDMRSSFRSMLFTLAMAVFLVYLVMASQFESLLHPFVILFTIPLALVGAVLALFVTGTTINVVAFIGLIMLAGIVVNNAIVLIDLINQLRAGGMTKTAAIIEAGRARLRPILMTTLTTILGLLPMALGFGDGAEVRTPMAITVIGGLTTSTALTLLVIPVVYSLLDREPLGRTAPALTREA